MAICVLDCGEQIRFLAPEARGLRFEKGKLLIHWHLPGPGAQFLYYPRRSAHQAPFLTDYDTMFGPGTYQQCTEG